MATVILKGSERTTLPGARVIGPADPAERLEVSVLVRRRSLQTLQTRVAALASCTLCSKRSLQSKARSAVIV